MNKSRSTDLPDFKNPPVIEVALSVQFKILESLRTPHLGLFWSKFNKIFKNVEEHEPTPPAFEKFEPPSVPQFKVSLQTSPPVPRCWFLNEKGTELIQIQQDRFVQNWRKVGEGDSYPRYEYIRERFKEKLEIFIKFLEEEKLGKMDPNQCSITYVNHIVPCEVWEKHGELDKVFTVWSSRYSDSFLKGPENITFTEKHIMADKEGKPIGRLHINLEPRSLIEKQTPVFVLKLTARGIPGGKEVEDVLRFLDVGRNWIVRGFTSITTKPMHNIWRRCDDN